jgi:hypothetical protein
MTTSSDGALPNPGENQADPAAVAAAAAAATPQEPAEVDIDEQAIIDATKAAEAEEAAAAAAANGTTVEPGKETPAVAKPGEQQQDQNVGDGVMIPKARFDEVNGRVSKAETDAAYWRGVAEARGQAQPAAKPGEQGAQQQQIPTADQRLTAIQAQQDILAKKFDDGEITYSDLVKQQRTLANQEQSIREEVLLAKVKPAETGKASDGNDLYLDTVTAQLETEHPWVEVFEAVGTKTQWDSLRNEAFDNLIERKIDPTTPTGKYELRKEVATLMDQRGPSMLTEKAKAKGIAIPGQQTPAAQQQQLGADGKPVVPAAKKSPLAQVREAKLNLQENAPPNVTSMSGTAVNANGMTDAQIEAMGEDQYDALSETQRNSLLGITG